MDSPEITNHRRPIKAREWRVWHWVALRLAHWGVTPNSISILGMLFGISGGCAFWYTGQSHPWAHIGFLVAALSIQLRLLANLLDGMVAIEGKKFSAVGELFNDVPDRIADAAILIGAGYAQGGDPILGYIAACGALMTAYIRALGRSLTQQPYFQGPMAKQQRMAVLTVAALYLAFSPENWQPTWHDRGLVACVLAIIICGSIWTCWRRLRLIANHLQRGVS